MFTRRSSSILRLYTTEQLLVIMIDPYLEDQGVRLEGIVPMPLFHLQRYLRLVEFCGKWRLDLQIWNSP